jgi:hypothetical protein
MEIQYSQLKINHLKDMPSTKAAGGGIYSGVLLMDVKVPVKVRRTLSSVGTSSSNTGLNHQQQIVYCVCSEYFSYESQRRVSLLGRFEQSVAPPILVIHGTPSTEKSSVVKAISDQAHELVLGDMTCAYTGSAASNLGAGRTILSMLGIEMMRTRINEHLACLSPVALTWYHVAF